MPDLDTADDRLYTIPGSPPNLLHEKPGDAFAPRNHFALNIDDEVDPPMFKITDTHYAATWLLDPRAPGKTGGRRSGNKAASAYDAAAGIGYGAYYDTGIYIIWSINT